MAVDEAHLPFLRQVRNELQKGRERDLSGEELSSVSREAFSAAAAGVEAPYSVEDLWVTWKRIRWVDIYRGRSSSEDRFSPINEERVVFLPVRRSPTKN